MHRVLSMPSSTHDICLICITNAANAFRNTLCALSGMQCALSETHCVFESAYPKLYILYLQCIVEDYYHAHIHANVFYNNLAYHTGTFYAHLERVHAHFHTPTRTIGTAPLCLTICTCDCNACTSTCMPMKARTCMIPCVHFTYMHAYMHSTCTFLQYNVNSMCPA